MERAKGSQPAISSSSDDRLALAAPAEGM